MDRALLVNLILQHMHHYNSLGRWLTACCPTDLLSKYLFFFRYLSSLSPFREQVYHPVLVKRSVRFRQIRGEAPPSL